MADDVPFVLCLLQPRGLVLRAAVQQSSCPHKVLACVQFLLRKLNVQSAWHRDRRILLAN